MTARQAAITAAHPWAIAGRGWSFPRIPVKDRRVPLRHPISVQGAPDLATIQPILAPRPKATPSSSAGAGRATVPSSTCSKSRWIAATAKAGSSSPTTPRRTTPTPFPSPPRRQNGNTAPSTASATRRWASGAARRRSRWAGRSQAT